MRGSLSKEMLCLAYLRALATQENYGDAPRSSPLSKVSEIARASALLPDAVGPKIAISGGCAGAKGRASGCIVVL